MAKNESQPVPLDVKYMTICDSTAQMIEKARADGVTLDHDRAAAMKACPIGADSACCKHCGMGPCRLSSKDPYAKVGVCGATIDTIMSRNFARMVATGTAAHSDHGLVLLKLFRQVALGRVPDYQIKDELKLQELAERLGIETEGRETADIALDLADELEKTFIQTEGEIPLLRLAPEKTLDTWRKLGVAPRGAMREVMELLLRTHIGVDQDYKNITRQSSRTALADGWGGSMVATELSDILFGTPYPVQIEVDMGVLDEKQVNVLVHGHEPALLEAMMVACADPHLIAMAREAGASGINLVGMCCSGLEVLGRHGLPHAGNFNSTEAVLVTGAVDAMAVDVQCIKQGMAQVSECYGTRFITTNERCHIEGAEHVPFDDHHPRDCADAIIVKAVNRFRDRKGPVVIPKNRHRGVAGFSYESINYMLGGTFRGSYAPLNDNIINGRIRGVAGVVGCNNPRVRHDWVHVELVRELIRNDVLVLQTGCSQIALMKNGLTTPEAAHFAGPGLREVCEAVGMPPVLGLGACVDNSRILIAASEMVRVGGLGNSIADLPVAGAAPEWMSEKAVAIGQYFVASGVYTVFGVTFPIVQNTKFQRHLFEELEDEGMGKWGFAREPDEMARMIIEHIDKKRKALGLDRSRERLLVDMADRRALESAA
ncbi:MAG: anaerobic carbon-monoxide dehydrogenase catalytic subunit [Proteobacteria bacterium]|nr:anaerobic carbon-monoxide dehydrogenase catalytic subunit [Pseudomonadota bacterium]